MERKDWGEEGENGSGEEGGVVSYMYMYMSMYN